MTRQEPAADGAHQARIEIRNLIKTYRREDGRSIVPVDNVSLTVRQDEILVLLGPSGCGKTTLLRCVAGLERPDEGEIIIDGRTVFSSSRGIFEPPDRRRLSMVFQSYALWPHMTVAANVAYPLQCRGTATAESRKRVADILEMVGVGGLERQYPGQLSGGQQQRVALARALVAASTVVLFDEPLSNVDALVRAQLRFELKRMQARLGFSGLYVTHDQIEAMELGHRIAVLRSGRIAALGAPKDVYRHPPSEYVATFVGTANVWQGTVTGGEGGRLVVETPLGTLLAPPARGLKAGFAPGEAVKIVARPEALQLGQERPEGQANLAEVTVEATLFSGAHSEVVVNRGDAQARVWVQGNDDIAQSAFGRPLWLTLPTDGIAVVPADDRPGA